MSAAHLPGRLARVLSTLALSIAAQMATASATHPSVSVAQPGLQPAPGGQLTAAQPGDFQTIGRAQLRVALWRVYDAELSSPSGRYRPRREPLLLSLTYHRAIAAQQLVSNTLDQLSSRLPAEQLTRVGQQLQTLWPDVSKGETLAFLLTPAGRGKFFFNGVALGALDDPEFNRAFLAIWLGRDSAYPKMANRLRGEY